MKRLVAIGGLLLLTVVTSGVANAQTAARWTSELSFQVKMVEKQEDGRLLNKVRIFNGIFTLCTDAGGTITACTDAGLPVPFLEGMITGMNRPFPTMDQIDVQLVADQIVQVTGTGPRGERGSLIGMGRLLDDFDRTIGNFSIDANVTVAPQAITLQGKLTGFMTTNPSVIGGPNVPMIFRGNFNSRRMQAQ